MTTRNQLKMPSKSPFDFSEQEKKYLQREKNIHNSIYSAYPNSVQEGFEYFFQRIQKLEQ